MPRDALVVFADDYGRHPSSCQRLIGQMLTERQVLWVNTIGMRRPRLRPSDASRAFSKLRQWCRPTPLAASQLDTNPIIVNPPMWPTFRNRLARTINAHTVAHSVRKAMEHHVDGPAVALTTLPITADLIGRLPVRRWVYCMVDDFTAWPELDHEALRRMENDQLQRVDAVAAVSEPLARRAAKAHHQPTIITHGVDLEQWQTPTPLTRHEPVLDRIASLPTPRALFWGLIDARLDATLLVKLATTWPGSIVLIGPTMGDVSTLMQIERVHVPGAIRADYLPHAAALADVLIMPYVDAPVTRAMQPLKLLEYLATDRPAVCTDLPAVREWDDCCDVTNRDTFVGRVLERAATGLTDEQRAARRLRLPSQSWSAKAKLLETLIDEHRDESAVHRAA